MNRGSPSALGSAARRRFRPTSPIDVRSWPLARATRPTRRAACPPAMLHGRLALPFSTTVQPYAEMPAALRYGGLRYPIRGPSPAGHRLQACRRRCHRPCCRRTRLRRMQPRKGSCHLLGLHLHRRRYPNRTMPRHSASCPTGPGSALARNPRSWLRAAQRNESPEPRAGWSWRRKRS